MRTTKVRLLPNPFAAPETVNLSVSPDLIGPGPSDNRLYVVNPKQAKIPYQYPDLPPFTGTQQYLAINPKQMASLSIDHPSFIAVHLYGVTRFVLDVWEYYFGHSIPWWFHEHYSRLELVTQADFHNAHCGYGYLETGYSCLLYTSPSPRDPE